MSNNALSIFGGSALAVPTHVAGFFETESNIVNGLTVPSLSYEGKVWTVSVNGDKTRLMKRDADGDEAPVATMRVVVLDFNSRRGRALYEGAYDPAKVSAPVCWSDDGVAPDKSIEAPKCGTCKDCPMAVKGSKVTEQGKATTACSQHRMIAVVPANDLSFTPLRMKIAITSDWDGQSPDLQAQGWYAFSNYTDFLKSKGVQHTAALVTKMKFDPSVAYPKVIFSPDRWLEQDELAKVKPLVQAEETKALLGGTWTPAGADGVQKATATTTEAPKPTPEPEPEAKAPTVVVDDDDDDNVVIQLPGTTSAAEETKAAAAKPAKAAKPKAVEKAPEEAAPVASGDVPDDVASLLAEWGDD